MQKTEFKRVRIADKSLITGLLRLVIGFLLGAARVGSMRPFGIGYAAASKNDDMWSFCGAFLGSLIVLGGKGGILYSAAIMICFACRMVFRETKIGKNRAFLPLSAGLAVICVKAAGLLQGLSVSAVIILFFEGALSCAVSLLFSLTKEDKPRGVYLVSKAVILIGALFAFEPLRLFGFISLSRTVSAAMVIFVGLFYGSGAGAGAGIALGALFDMAIFGPPKIAFIYGLGGLLCGGGKTSPRILRLIMWMVGCVSAYVWCKIGDLAIVAECILCGGLVAFLSPNIWEKIQRQFQGKTPPDHYEISPDISAAISKMGEEIGKNSPARRGNEMQKVLDRAADGVCVTCPNAKECWREDYVATSGALTGVGALAKGKSEVCIEDFPKRFLEKCTRAEQFCREINRQLRASRSRVGAAKRKDEAAALMKRQYEGMSTLFTDISTPRATEIKAVLSSEVVSCAVPKKGEKECGDTVCHFVTSDLRQIVLLSDGMGSGNKASSASKRAVEMLKDLITAGAGIIAATEATVPVLEAKFESCGFVTLDLLQIDLKNGEAIFVKYGATPSYILRGDGQKQVWKQSLPAGLGDEGAVLKATLKAGDRIVMTSDGVVMPEVLQGEGRDICELLVKGKSEDDKTALAVSIREA